MVRVLKIHSKGGYKIEEQKQKDKFRNVDELVVSIQYD